MERAVTRVLPWAGCGWAVLWLVGVKVSGAEGVGAQEVGCQLIAGVLVAAGNRVNWRKLKAWGS